ncbi:MAG TPA: flagellar basal body-associated FliL family protein [Bdellovibrionales bacterium]|nr:flagellar basal body-associated FliL family protein [Bdellovibrionales bacterium]
MAKRPVDEELPPAKKPIPWGFILKSIFVFANVATLAGGTLVIYLNTVAHEPKSITETTASADVRKKQQDLQAHPVIYTLDPFSVNLDGLPRRFIRTVISVEMLDDKGFEEIVGLGAQSRDAIVRLLNGKTYDDLETIQGKLFLKDQIASVLNKQLRAGVVKDIYFNEFVIQ